MNMLGVIMDCLSYEDLFVIFDNWLSNKNSRSHSIALANVNCCVSALFDRRLKEIYESADIVGIDSMPFLRWSRTFYSKNCDHVNAPDLFLKISSKCKMKGYTYFFYGGYPGSPEKMEAYLHERFEGINVVGKYSPPFRALTEDEDKAICDTINDIRPDFLWVGLGSPKQDIWINEHREKIRGTIMIAAGATFDFYSGRVRQAPQWIRNACLEWLYRLLHDFKRLWVRYTVYNVIFLFVFSLQKIGVIKFKNQRDQYKYEN